MVVKEDSSKEMTFRVRPEGCIRVNQTNGTAGGGEEAGIKEFQVEKKGYREEFSESMTPLGNRNKVGQNGAQSLPQVKSFSQVPRQREF